MRLVQILALLKLETYETLTIEKYCSRLNVLSTIIPQLPTFTTKHISSMILFVVSQIKLLFATIIFVILSNEGYSLLRTGGAVRYRLFLPVCSSSCSYSAFKGERRLFLLHGGSSVPTTVTGIFNRTTKRAPYQITITTAAVASRNIDTGATDRHRTNNQTTGSTSSNTSSDSMVCNNDVETKPSSWTNHDTTAVEEDHDSSSIQDDARKNIHTHYIFLVHGWLGNSSEMGYLESSIQRQVKEYMQNLQEKVESSGGMIPKIPRIVTHSATANDAKTTDGIANGGKRLAEEIQQFIQQDISAQLAQDSHFKDHGNAVAFVGISLVGNSLGGLYARYALSLLGPMLCSQSTFPSSSSSNNDNNNNPIPIPIQLCPEIFATTATPHLGVSRHTFLPLPRSVEHIVGRTLQSTGRDLFRVDPDEDVIYQMSTDYEKFLRPLEKFRKRVAYANAFRTDFQVPTATAAFLSRNSTFPHWIRSGEEEDGVQGFPPSFLVAVAETDPNHNVLVEDVKKDHGINVDGNENGRRWCKIHAMSVKLDALGWQKVFVDVREYIPLPGISLPSFVTRGSRERWNDFLKSPLQESEDNGEKGLKKMVQSKDLEKFMSSSDRIDIPVGHQVMVANSKNPNYSSFTSKGRPVMDYFAKRLVRNLLRDNNGSNINFQLVPTESPPRSSPPPWGFKPSIAPSDEDSNDPTCNAVDDNGKSDDSNISTRSESCNIFINSDRSSTSVASTISCNSCTDMRSNS